MGHAQGRPLSLRIRVPLELSCGQLDLALAKERYGILPKLHAFLKTHVYQFRDDPKEESLRLSLLPDLYVRWLMFDVLSELQETNMSTHRKLTAGENVDLQLDPDTLEHLRGLGYVN
jgi:hypothetical protein